MLGLGRQAPHHLVYGRETFVRSSMNFELVEYALAYADIGKPGVPV